jgi:hypothetical protein
MCITMLRAFLRLVFRPRAHGEVLFEAAMSAEESAPGWRLRSLSHQMMDGLQGSEKLSDLDVVD